MECTAFVAPVYLKSVTPLGLVQWTCAGLTCACLVQMCEPEYFDYDMQYIQETMGWS